MSFGGYDFSGSVSSEQYNTLVLLDNAFEQHPEIHTPIFHVLGGTALLFHGINSVATIDIDTANTLSKEVREIVEPFISDAASEVAVIPKGYELRMIPYKPESFKKIKVYLLSLEDLLVTKLAAWRHKDIEDITKTNLLDKVDYSLLDDLINSIPQTLRDELFRRLSIVK